MMAVAKKVHEKHIKPSPHRDSMPIEDKHVKSRVYKQSQDFGYLTHPR